MPEIRWGMVIDLRRCIGCHSCSVACKAENKVPLKVFRTWVKIVEKGSDNNASRQFLPWLCNNCANPICLTNCPVKATWQREDGIVMVDEHRCIGCKYCIASCPYNVRHINPLMPIVQKCYWCYHRVDEGLLPACVETCPGQARIFGNLKDPSSEISRLLSHYATHTLKPEMGTYPQVFYIGLDEDTADPFRGRKDL